MIVVAQSHSSIMTLLNLNFIIIACAVSLFASTSSFAFQSSAANPRIHQLHQNQGNVDSESSLSLELSSDVDFQSLMVMDVVLFQRRETDADTTTTLEIGAVQENGHVAPLSTWTLESVYTSATNDMMEFVADEEDMFPGLSSDDIQVVKVLDGSMMSYGSRQVGGGKGPGNPHGEESEMLYYVDRSIVEGIYRRVENKAERGITIDVTVNPDLEHLW
mmetsp:Transcript_16928/g.36610  ORF Transcript_16928/g.36610 Transcript_16928/m.36610 type:complete len:218 (+) Transcript_16928:13-666(+)